MKENKSRPFLELAQAIDQEWLDSNRSIGPTLDEDLAVTGQPYQTLITEVPRLDEHAALMNALDVFKAYAREHYGTLYWRTAPMINCFRQKRKWAYRVTIQILISDNPVVPRLLHKSVSHFYELGP